MVDMKLYDEEILTFINTSIEKFSGDHGQAKSIGIYVCPWAGWLTTNFNLIKTIEDTKSNCPDFEFVEFDLLELPEFQREYESHAPCFLIGDKIMEMDTDLGNEGVNVIVFNVLLPLIRQMKKNMTQEILVQMLDSNYYQVL